MLDARKKDMLDERKKALIVLAQQFAIAIIEDDAYGELADAYGELADEYPRPRTIKSFERTIKSFDNGGEFCCAAHFPKVWLLGCVWDGLHLDAIWSVCYTPNTPSTGYTVTHTQLAVAEFIRQGHYQPHVRLIRAYYKSNLDTFTCWVPRYFSCGICVSRPQGGFLMWIEFPETFETLRLNSLASGSLFSASGKYRNCMRVHYGLPLTYEMQQMLRVIGEQAEHMLHEDTVSGH